MTSLGGSWARRAFGSVSAASAWLVWRSVAGWRSGVGASEALAKSVERQFVECSWCWCSAVSAVRRVGTFCGVFRRQALDRGASKLGVNKMVTGHNADDIAETVVMNVLRGDIARLQRCTAITTGSEGAIPRSKPFKYTYEKEIVMYAHFKKLDYFSTECIYSPNAYRCLESGVSTDPEPCGFARPRMAVRGFPVSGEKGILVVEPSPG
ncbi:cytoplasmic tRNA 2-thiolation protein 1-like isoform X2 [Ixodes scapularis]